VTKHAKVKFFLKIYEDIGSKGEEVAGALS
jgi:hypothetical protein